jgi:hypothetical protein
MNSNETKTQQEEITLTPQERVKEHKVGLIVVGIGFVILILILSFSDMGGGFQTQEKEEEEVYTVTIADPTKNTKTEDRWLVDAQSKIDTQDEKVSTISEENKLLKQKLHKLEEEKISQNEKFANIISQVEILSNKIEQQSQQNAINQNNSNNNNTLSPIHNQEPTITTITFDEDDGGDNLLQKQTTFNTQEGYIPQGSYAPAKIISVVDAQVGISSQSNPKPVLLRITGDAKSAIFKDKKLAIDIQGCIITAGAIGELSSEKVYIKLSKMTCAKNNNEVMEVSVQGYISAKGSNGIRGQVVMKEGSMIGKSFLAGMIGGLGQAYSQSLAPPLTFGGGTTTQTAIGAGDAVKRGIGGGVGQSGNQISQYLIKRAEQYQPVISIPSGIEVEVVFLDGFYLDGRPKETPQNNTNENTL